MMNHQIDTIVREAAARLDHEIMISGRTMAAYEFRDLLEDHIRQALERLLMNKTGMCQ